MWLFPLHSALLFCLRKLLQKYLQVGLRERLKRKNARRVLYNRLRRYPNKSKRQEGAFILKLTVVFLKVRDEVTTWLLRLDTGDTQTHMNVYRCAHKHRKKHTNRDFSVPLILLADTLEKAQTEREMRKLVDTVILNVCIYKYMCVFVVCMCMEEWDFCVSCPVQCVTAYPDPDPSLRATSHHPSQSLMALSPQGLHGRMSFGGLRGLFAAGMHPVSRCMKWGKGEKDCCHIIVNL